VFLNKTVAGEHTVVRVDPVAIVTAVGAALLITVYTADCAVQPKELVVVTE
jgi:hypothetical protein